MNLRPILGDQPESIEALRTAMDVWDYPYAREHDELLQYAVVFTIVMGEEMAGYIWFYRIRENDRVWAFHALAFPKHQGHFLTRDVLEQIGGAIYCLGADSVLIDGEWAEFATRFGGHQEHDGTYIDLPYRFRRTHGKAN